MSTIRDTVIQSLRDAGRASYLSYAEPVIAALEEREGEIVSAVQGVAGRYHLSGKETASILIEVGLVESDEGTVTGTGEVTREEFNALAARLEAGIAAAARHGVRI